MDNLKLVIAGVVGGLLVLIGSFLIPHSAAAPTLGVSVAANVTTVSNPWRFLGGFTWGTNGTSITAIKTGSCTIWANATTIAASTTKQVECQSATNGTLASGLTGVTADSICSLIMASSTNAVSNGLSVEGVSASSTAGSIVGQISNLTGGTFTWDAAASSSPKWNYFCVDPA